MSIICTNNLVKFYYEYKKNNKQLLTEYETVVNDSTLKKFLTQVELKGMEEKTNYNVIKEIEERSDNYKHSRLRVPFGLYLAWLDFGKLSTKCLVVFVCIFNRFDLFSG